MAAWLDIPWNQVHRHVFRLQKRIYQATQRGDVRTARKLQNLLVKSWYARLLAVRRISQENRGKNTAGIDGVKSLTPAGRWRLAQSLRLNGQATALRRTWIPKRGSATEKRPLGIPTQHDDRIEIDHINGDRRNSRYDNLQALHGHCHHAKTREHQDYLPPGMRDKHQDTEERCDAKVSCPVLDQR
jgi:hypothetical protein